MRAWCSCFSFLLHSFGGRVFNWTATLYKGSVSFSAPMLYGIGFIGLFTMGGLTGLFLASIAVDVHVHDTYFIVAYHYIMVRHGAAAAVFNWWPKLTGRFIPKRGRVWRR
jgi:cytochrome c oxidase subunit 1